MKVWIFDSYDEGVTHVFDSEVKARKYMLDCIAADTLSYINYCKSNHYNDTPEAGLKYLSESLEAFTEGNTYIEDVGSILQMEVE